MIVKLNSTEEEVKKEGIIYTKILNDKGGEKVAGLDYSIDASCVDSLKTDQSVLGEISRVTYLDGTSKYIVAPFETLLGFDIAKNKLIFKGSLCVDSEVMVNDNGVEKSFEQFYKEEYAQASFDDGIHEALTKNDTAITDDKQAIDLTEVKGVDLDGENVLGAAAKTI